MTRSASRGLSALCALALGGCALSSNVTIMPLHLTPNDIQRHPNAVVAFDRGDYAAVLSRADIIESLSDDPIELAALGRAELFAMRLADAETHLSRALEHERNRERRARLHWDLAQVAMMNGDLARALEKANEARNGGLEIRRWYFRLHEQLLETVPNELAGSVRNTEVDLQSDRPAIPRILVGINGHPARGVVDTGSSLSIISGDLADGLGVRRYPDTRAVVQGLLSEPIDVDFGLIESLEIGSIEIRNVPVAIMATRKLQFAIGGRERFQIDLLLGTGLLRNFTMELDYRQDRATFEWTGDLPPDPSPDQNLFLIESRPFLMAAINGRAWFPMMLDTGSEVTFLNLSKIEVRDLRSAFPRIHSANLQGLGGAIKTGVRIENVSIGAARWMGVFDDLPLYRDERTDTLGILGQNFLEHFVLKIDFRRMHVALVR